MSDVNEFHLCKFKFNNKWVLTVFFFLKQQRTHKWLEEISHQPQHMKLIFICESKSKTCFGGDNHKFMLFFVRNPKEGNLINKKKVLWQLWRRAAILCYDIIISFSWITMKNRSFSVMTLIVKISAHSGFEKNKFSLK